ISKEDPSLPREYSIGLADMVGHVKSMFTSLYTQSIRAGIYSTCLYACDQHLKSTSNRRGIRAGPQNKRKKRQAGSQNDDQRRSRRRLLMTALGAHAERPWTARSRLPRKLARTVRGMALRNHNYCLRRDRGMGHHRPLWLLCSWMDRDTYKSDGDFDDPCFGVRPCYSIAVSKQRLSQKKTRKTPGKLLADVGHGLPYRRRCFLLTSPGPVHVSSMSKDERVDGHVDESRSRGIALRSRSSKSSKPSKDESSKSSSSKSKSISQPRSRSSRPRDPPIHADMPISIHVSNPYKYLHRAGYADPAIAGMILALNSVDKEKAKKNMNAWVKENDKKEVERRNKSYAERARKAGWPGKLGSHGPEVEGGEEGKLKLKIPEDSINKAEEAMRLEEVPAEERKKVLSLLKNPKSNSEIQMAAKILERMGIPVEGPKKNSTQEIRGSSSSKPESKVKHKFGESDGQGGYRDIQLSKGTVRNLAKGMMVRGWSEADINQWYAYLQRPFSRREIEIKVIPLAKSVDVYLGGGYTGGGPHRFDTKKLQAFKTQLRDKWGVDNNFAEHMMLVAINQPTAKESQELFNRWLTNGLSRAEFDQLRKTGPDWA
ncbi:hypothetical protein C360_06766, partial [Cryptococcus neoformans Bt15]